MSNQNKAIAVVQFPSGYKDYSFKNHIEDLVIGDQVVCDTVNGLTVGKVVNFKDVSASATKWIVQKIDLTAHRARVEKQKEIDRIRKELEKRRKEIQDIELYALLAKNDDTMADLLGKLTTLLQPEDK